MKVQKLGAILAAFAFLASSTVLPADTREAREVRIDFAEGATGAVTEGTIKGYEYVDYLLNVRAGQVLNINLATKHTATYFNQADPGAFSTWRQDDTSVVHIGEETYFLPDAVIYGG